MRWFVAITAVTVASASVLKDTSEHADEYPDILEDRDICCSLFDSQEMVNETHKYCKDPKNKYWLFTRSNPTTPVILDPNNLEGIKDIIITKEIVVLVHGWRGTGLDRINTMLTEAFLQNNDVNVIVLDWSHVADSFYTIATIKTSAVGKALGEFIDNLCSIGASYNMIHVVGFSLGAHVVGYAGKATGGKIKRITGLDPAGPLWDLIKSRLNSGDAQYVEAIHTNTGCLGISLRSGDADFFVNKGPIMPGCSTFSCSHSRAYEYMASSIIYNHFLANECKDMDEVRNDECTGPTTNHMGNDYLNKTRTGIFRINTGKYYPFFNSTEFH